LTARSKARKRALDLLFESDLRGVSATETLAAWSQRNDPPVQPYAHELVEGIVEHRDRIDDVIRRYAAQDWPLERMPAVDRAALRLGIYELLCCDIPPAVAINEAVELAKSLSTDDSPGFVNGILAQVLRDKKSLVPLT
jgi:transcription antitermination protein NusB